MVGVWRRLPVAGWRLLAVGVGGWWSMAAALKGCPQLKKFLVGAS